MDWPLIIVSSLTILMGLCLLIAWALIRSGARDEYDCEIDEELLEDDLRRELSDIRFHGAAE